MNTVEFLDLVLPSEGHRCAFIVSPSAQWHSKFDKNEELSAYLIEQDQAGNTAYYACASYRDAGRHRRQKDVFQIQDFWVDWDDKSFVSHEEARAAFRVFVDTFHLPDPLVISTGGGYHLHWPLDHPLSVKEWKPY